jgi:hypothetical protein
MRQGNFGLAGRISGKEQPTDEQTGSLLFPEKRIPAFLASNRKRFHGDARRAGSRKAWGHLPNILATKKITTAPNMPPPQSK